MRKTQGARGNNEFIFHFFAEKIRRCSLALRFVTVKTKVQGLLGEEMNSSWQSTLSCRGDFIFQILPYNGSQISFFTGQVIPASEGVNRSCGTEHPRGNGK
jgi:hypothetical protein